MEYGMMYDKAESLVSMATENCVSIQVLSILQELFLLFC